MNGLSNPIGPLQHDAAFDLSFRLRQPLPARPKACVLLLHGVGGSEMNLAELADAIDPDTLVVLPRGPLEFAPGQFGWFRVAFTASGPSIVAAEAEQSRQAVIRFIGQLQAAYGVDAQKTVIAGFIAHGEFDSKLPVMWAQRADSLLAELGVAHETRLYAMGHEISAAVKSDFLHWLGER